MAHFMRCCDEIAKVKRKKHTHIHISQFEIWILCVRYSISTILPTTATNWESLNGFCGRAWWAPTKMGCILISLHIDELWFNIIYHLKGFATKSVSINYQLKSVAVHRSQVVWLSCLSIISSIIEWKQWRPHWIFWSINHNH